jgi:hypothetical protein
MQQYFFDQLVYTFVVNLLDQLSAQLFMYITYITSTCFNIENTIFREHVMPSLKLIVSRDTTYL